MVALMAEPLTVPLVMGSVMRTLSGIEIGFDGAPRLRLATKMGVKPKGREEAEMNARNRVMARKERRRFGWYAIILIWTEQERL
jgi:hypothetical protein